MEKMTKAQARAKVIAEGFTIHFDTGSSGDYAHGSREYFMKPDAEMNEWGFPKNKNATISKVGNTWHITRFGV